MDTVIVTVGYWCQINMKSRYILTALLAAILTFAYISDPVDTPEPEVRHVIKLTTRHLPIHKYFAQDDEDDNLTVAQQYMIVRRETAVKAKVDVRPTEDDIQISDGVRLRLWLAREKAMNAYRQKYQA